MMRTAEYARGVSNICAPAPRMHPLSSKAWNNGIAISVRKHLFPDTTRVIISGMTCLWYLVPRGPASRFTTRSRQLIALKNVRSAPFSPLYPDVRGGAGGGREFSLSRCATKKNADRVIERITLGKIARAPDEPPKKRRRNVENALSICLTSIKRPFFFPCFLHGRRNKYIEEKMFGICCNRTARGSLPEKPFLQ